VESIWNGERNTVWDGGCRYARLYWAVPSDVRKVYDLPEQANLLRGLCPVVLELGHGPEVTFPLTEGRRRRRPSAHQAAQPQNGRNRSEERWQFEEPVATAPGSDA
jgi:hypothetical protein